VQKRLQVLFAGQAQTAAASYTGSMNKLAVASENASEKIGKSLLDALTAVSGGKTVDDTVKKIDTLSSAIAGLIDVTVGLKAGEYLQQYYALKDGKIAGGFGNRSLSVLGQDTQKSDLVARQKAETDAKKRAAELLAAQKKTLKSQQDALKLAKARAIFDLQKIQIEAALKGKLSEEDRLRLLLMKAIENENISDIEKYTKLLTDAQAKAKELQTTLDAIKNNKVSDPFAEFRTGLGKTIEQLNEANKQLGLMTTIQKNLREYTPPQLTTVGAYDKNGDFTMPTVVSPTATTAPTSQPSVVINNNVQTGVGDPNAIAEAIDEVLTQAVQRGTLRGGMYAV
jgi:hypothetical protein